jgi:lipoyl(octanoyl) transferase
VDLGRVRYGAAWDLQKARVEQRKRGEIPDQLLLAEHPHVVTMGRNGKLENLLAPPELLERAGIDYHEVNRGGDVTYHGPGQLVGYPILDLRDWKRDVGAYVRALEGMLIGALRVFGIEGERLEGNTGVWVQSPAGALAKIAAIGVHLSRWVTSHGFALNVNPDLSYFQYIVPCGLTLPVTSMAALGCRATLQEVAPVVLAEFGRQFDRKIQVFEEMCTQ